MVEQDKKPDVLELEFRDLEKSCVEIIQKCWENNPDPKATGVNFEIDANEDIYLILSLNNDGVWNVTTDFGEYEIGKNPPLTDLLDVYALIDEDEGYLGIVLSPMKAGNRDKQRIEYLNKHKERLAEGLMDAMQSLLNESK